MESSSHRLSARWPPWAIGALWIAQVEGCFAPSTHPVPEGRRSGSRWWRPVIRPGTTGSHAPTPSSFRPGGTAEGGCGFIHHTKLRVVLDMRSILLPTEHVRDGRALSMGDCLPLPAYLRHANFLDACVRWLWSLRLPSPPANGPSSLRDGIQVSVTVCLEWH
jgi:hypothetical protein